MKEDGMLNMINPMAVQNIEKLETSDINIGEYTLHEHTWTQKRKHHREWVLSIDVSGAPRLWRFKENPLTSLDIDALYMGAFEQKWLNYEGTLEPGEHLNFIDMNKTRLTLLARGTAYVQFSSLGGAEKIDMTMNNGKMEGGWSLVSKNPGSTEYIFNPTPKPEHVIKEEQSEIHVKENPSNYTITIYPETLFKEVTSATKSADEYNIEIQENVWVKLGYYDRPELSNGVAIQSIILPKHKYSKEDIKKLNLEQYIEWRGNRK